MNYVETIRAILNWAKARLGEPSTIITLGFALAYFHVPVSQTALQVGADGARDIIIGITMILGVILPEGKVPPAPASGVVADRTVTVGN